MDHSPPGSSVHGILQQECWSGLPCPPPGGLSDTGLKLTSLTSPELQVGSSPLEPPRKPLLFIWYNRHILCLRIGFPGGSVVKTLLANAGDPGLILGGEDPLKKEMATHSSTLTWEIPRTKESGGLQSMGSQGLGHDSATEHAQPC